MELLVAHQPPVRRAPPAVARHGGPAGSLLALQRAAGNRAVTACLDGRHAAPAPLAGVPVQRQAAESRESRTLRDFVSRIVEKVDDEDADKVFLSLVLNGLKLDARAFGHALVARRNATHGNYLTAVVRMLEDDFGTRVAVFVLETLARNGVDVQAGVQAPSLQPVAVVAQYKALVRTYNALVAKGRISAEDIAKVKAAVAEVSAVLRGIEARKAKAGPRVQIAGGAAVAAGALWKTAAALAADDVTGVGVADDIAIPFVVIGAVVLSGIALLAGRTPPEILDYAPAQASAKAAVLLMQQVISRPVAPTVPMPPMPPPMELGKNKNKKDKPTGPQKDAEPGTKTTPVPLEPPGDKRRKYPHEMRFQVQWDTNGKDITFSEPAVATGPPGVTVAQAIAALTAVHNKTVPEPAREAATPAVEKQKRWVAARPASGGISQNFISWSEYFDYKKYDDARVDVENMVGHNLRQ